MSFPIADAYEIWFPWSTRKTRTEKTRHTLGGTPTFQYGIHFHLSRAVVEQAAHWNEIIDDGRTAPNQNEAGLTPKSQHKFFYKIVDA
jgi:hypothetical protein